MSDSVQGSFGGQAWKMKDDIVFRFKDGTVKAVVASSVKACLEEHSYISAEGLSIRSDNTVTHVYFGELSLTFSNDELFSMLR